MIYSDGFAKVPLAGCCSAKRSRAGGNREGGGLSVLFRLIAVLDSVDYPFTVTTDHTSCCCHFTVLHFTHLIWGFVMAAQVLKVFRIWGKYVSLRSW